jgi:hypothetical protein
MSSDIFVNNDWEIQIQCFQKLNFALQQSSVPFIGHLSIHNNTDENQDKEVYHNKKASYAVQK